MIQYKKGDATRPEGPGNKIILHVCNDIGGWGKGFVMAISKRWPEPERMYRDWHASQENFKLGEAQLVQVEENIWVANIVGQHKIHKDENGNPPIRYDSIREGLHKVGRLALDIKATIHMPRIGCGLAGGTWDKIEPILEETLIVHQLEVTVYDF
jgi:O-acetyl-ADP-ribose deacetylase (regulator of RNase III)